MATLIGRLSRAILGITQKAIRCSSSKRAIRGGANNAGVWGKFRKPNNYPLIYKILDWKLTSSRSYTVKENKLLNNCHYPKYLNAQLVIKFSGPNTSGKTLSAKPYKSPNLPRFSMQVLNTIIFESFCTCQEGYRKISTILHQHIYMATLAWMQQTLQSHKTPLQRKT